MAIHDLMTRINRVCEGLLGCQLEFLPAHSLNSGEWDSGDLELLKGNKTQMPSYVSSNDRLTFGFPINLHGAFAGLAVVQNLKTTRPRKLLLLAELLTTMLEHGLHQEEGRERLRLIEERFHLMDEDSNVVPLRPARLIQPLQVVAPSSIAEERNSPLTTRPLLIETHSGFPLNRVAIEVHHLSNKWAFIGSDDLPADTFKSRESIAQLGSITLFIRDLTQLSIEQQLRLSEFLAEERSDETPHVIAGVNSSPRALIEAGLLVSSLADVFCSAQLQWTEKTPEQVTIDLINASLRHLLEQARNSVSVGRHFVPFHMQYLDPDHSTVH